VKALTCLVLLGGIAPSAFAICPQPVPKACSAYFEHDAVFIGTVLSQRRSDDYLSFRIRVSRVLRGKVGSTAEVYTGNDSARLLWEVGREYVVFASRANGRLESSNDCGPLSEPVRVAETVAQIDALRGVPDAVIEGEVLAAQPDGPGVAGIQLEVRGRQGQTYRVRTGLDGLFALRVPPGRYQVVVDPEILQPSDYSWLDPASVGLAAGQCAQLQFVAKQGVRSNHLMQPRK